jgi:tetratricopeptide (TPR) repeat protein
MKYFSFHSFIFLFLLFLLNPSSLFARTYKDLENLKNETDLHAITKLEATLVDLDSSPSKVQVEIRLGDLYAEAARRQFQKEIESITETSTISTTNSISTISATRTASTKKPNTTTQNKITTKHSGSSKKITPLSTEQRQKALEYYKKALKALTDSLSIAETQFKMATLYSDIGEGKLALKTLNTLITNPSTPNFLKQRGFQHRGHAYFSSGQFKEAEQDYLEFLKYEKKLSSQEQELLSSPSHQEDLTLVFYRLAWSQMQLTKITESKNHYKKALDLLQKSQSKSGLDIYLDYASLLISEKSTSFDDISSLLKKAHPDFQVQLEQDIADEAFRVARYDIASPLYTQITKNKNQSDTIIILAKLRLVLVESKKNSHSLKHIPLLQSVIAESKQCDDSKNSSNKTCDLIKKEIRSYVLQVHKLKKAQPDAHVLETYKVYLNSYQEEAELFITAASVASYLDQHHDARTLYEKGILLEKNPKQKEDYLIANLSRAEASNQEQDKILSYLFYIQHGKNEKLLGEIEVELSSLDFKNQKYSEAFNRAYRVSQSKKFGLKSQEQAAEVAINSLIKENKNADILRVATLYSSQFKNKKNHYDAIAKKAKTNILIAETLQPKSLSSSSLVSKFNQLKELAESEKNLEEKKILIKNLNRISDEAENHELKVTSLLLFLKLKSLTEKEKIQASIEIYHLYIKEFQFKKALDFATNHQKLLQIHTIEIAQLADIQNQKQKALNLYEKSLKDSNLKKSEKAFIASRIILLSPNKGKSLNLYFSFLKLDSSIFDKTLTLLYLSQPLLRPTINTHIHSSRTPETFFAKNRVLGFDFLNQIYFKSSKSLALSHNPQSLKKYQDFLNDLDQKLKQAHRGDFLAAQVTLLKAIDFYNTKFVDDLKSLPIPKEIKKGTEDQYLKQIHNLSKPYLDKASLARKQGQNLESQLIQSLKKERESARVEILIFLNSEARLIENKLKNFDSEFHEKTLFKISQKRQETWKEDRIKLIQSQQFDTFYDLETQFGNPVLANFIRSKKIHTPKAGSL